MVTSSITQESVNAPGAGTRAQIVWQYAVQLIALALLALALLWAPNPLPVRKAVVAGLVGIWVVMLLVPRWRTSHWVGALGAVTLAVAVWLGVDHMLTTSEAFVQPMTDFIPRLLPWLCGAGVLAAGWGALARAGIVRNTALGAGALVGALLLTVWCLWLLNMMTHWVGPYQLNDNGQVVVLLSSVALYATAMWLGSAGGRPGARWPIFSLGAVLVMLVWLVCWR